MTAELTLGAEEELHLIDLESWQLSARAPQLLVAAAAARTTPPRSSAPRWRPTPTWSTRLDGLRSELLRLRRGLAEVAAAEGLGVAAVGTAPRSGFADFELTSTGRYGRMQEQYRLLVDEQLICGLQIHVGVADRDLAVAIMQRIARDLPVLLALSASSPFWNGEDTGYASIRTIIWQRWPSAGVDRAAPVRRRVRLAASADLINTGVIADAKMAYFDVRPSSHAPTLELRVCDACPIVDDAVLIAGLFRATVPRGRARDRVGAGCTSRSPLPIHRAAIWRAARGGLAGDLLDDTRHPQADPGRAGRPRPGRAAAAAAGGAGRLGRRSSELAETTLARGQLGRPAAGGAAPSAASSTTWSNSSWTRPADRPTGWRRRPRQLRTYRSRAGDEAVGLGSRPRPVYHEIVDFFRGTDTEVRQDRDAGPGQLDRPRRA